MVRTILIAAQILFVGMPQANAQHCYLEERTRWSHGHLITTVVQVCPEHVDVGDAGVADDEAGAPVGSAVCLAALGSESPEAQAFCNGNAEAPPPVVTGHMVSRELRRLALPGSELVVQPPGGRTLVNFDTNFYTTNDRPLLRSVTLLGQRVELRILPERYTWRFGDGEVVTTTSPGSPHPRLDVNHRYLEKGDFRPRVDTTYGAEWRLAGGQWRAVPGTAVIAGEPARLRAVEAHPTLMGHEG